MDTLSVNNTEILLVENIDTDTHSEHHRGTSSESYRERDYQ